MAERATPIEVPPPNGEELGEPWDYAGGEGVDGGRKRMSSLFSRFKSNSKGSGKGKDADAEYPKVFLSLHLNKGTLKVNLKQITGLRWVTEEDVRFDAYAKIYLFHKGERVFKKKFAVRNNTNNLAYYEAVEVGKIYGPMLYCIVIYYH